MLRSKLDDKGTFTTELKESEEAKLGKDEKMRRREDERARGGSTQTDGKERPGETLDGAALDIWMRTRQFPLFPLPIFFGHHCNRCHRCLTVTESDTEYTRQHKSSWSGCWVVYPTLGPQSRRLQVPRPFHYDLQSCRFHLFSNDNINNKKAHRWPSQKIHATGEDHDTARRGEKPMRVEPKPRVLGGKHPPTAPLASPYTEGGIPVPGRRVPVSY